MKTNFKSFRIQSFKFLLLAIFTGAFSLSNAQYYWVGGSGNWSDYENHWATSSGGSSFHSSPPGSEDDVIFDANSFAITGQIVTLDIADANCNSMDWSEVSNNPGFETGDNSYILNIFGSLDLSADMTCNLRFIELESETTGNTIRTSGTHLGPISILRFYGNGSWDLQDVLNVNSIQLLSGTVNTNNNTINADASFIPSGISPKAFNAGSSVINTSQWRMRGTNNSFDMGTSTIKTNSFYGDWENTGPYSYYHVEINEGGILYNDCSIHKLSLGNAGFAYNKIEVESGALITIEELEINASRRYPLEIQSTQTGSEATFSKSSGSINVEYVILQDIHAGGGASFTINNGIDNGNTNGWTINPITALDYYWVGNGGNWSDYSTHWATSSGGSTFHNSVPSRFDNVYFDAGSFSQDGQEVVIDSVFSCASLDFSGTTNSPALNAAYGNPLTVYGSVHFISELTGSIYNLDCAGAGTGNTFNTGGIVVQNLSFKGNGSWSLLSDVKTGNFNIHDACTFDSNGYDIEVSFSFSQYGKDISIRLDSSEIYTRDFSLRDEEIEFDAETSTIRVKRDFEGSNFSFNKVVLEEDANIVDQNTFNILEVKPGADASFEAGSTQTILQSLILNGTPGQPINLSSSEAGSQASLSLSSGTVNGSWLILQDMNATGGATFNATESTDNGNNTGWNITGILSQDFYWVGGSGNWSDYSNHWAGSSGGSDFRTREPASIDNVYFDENSFTAEGQMVTIDSEEVTFKSMSWTGALHTPRLEGSQKTMNIYGSLTLIPGMIVNVNHFNFFAQDEISITAGKSSQPGTNSYFYFLGTGHYMLQDSLTVREIHLNNGTFSTNDNWMHIDFRLYFGGYDQKILNLGESTFFLRGMGWNGLGDNLSLNGENSNLQFSSSLSTRSGGDSNVQVKLGNLSAVHNKFSDQASISSGISVDTFLIEPGKSLKITGGQSITTQQMIANGTEEDRISISSVQEGVQCSISQASGVVNGYFLELKDISATGGATFNAYNSLDLGNVSGWAFFKETQTIDFPAIGDKMSNDAPFELIATASSGLEVSFEILSGPATVNGITLSLTGEAGIVEVQASQPGDENFLPAASVKQSFEVLLPIGIREKVPDILIAWPNPAIDLLYLNPNINGVSSTYKILDLNGQILQYGKTKNSIIPLNNLNSGMYILLIHTNKQVYRKPFMKF